MESPDLLFAVVVGGLVWALVTYWVVRKAVCAAILDADRAKAAAAAEREEVKQQLRQWNDDAGLGYTGEPPT